MTKNLPKIIEKSSSTCQKPYWEYGWFCVSENPILVTYNLSIILVSNISLWLNDQGEKWCHILIHELISVYYRVGWSEKMEQEFKCNQFFFVIQCVQDGRGELLFLITDRQNIFWDFGGRRSLWYERTFWFLKKFFDFATMTMTKIVRGDPYDRKIWPSNLSKIPSKT